MVKILVIEDESFMRDEIKRALKIGGYTEIIEASSGEEGIKKYMKFKPEIVFLDLKLPGMQGEDVLKKIKGKKNSKSKVIILTTVNAEEMGQENILTLKDAKELGASSWIIKPITTEKIMKAIRNK